MTAARITDPTTSHDAADMAEAFLFDHHAKIVESLRVRGPGTIYEIAERTGIDHVAVARRMKELELKAWAMRTDETRPSPLGRQCTVWKYWSLV